MCKKVFTVDIFQNTDLISDDEQKEFYKTNQKNNPHSFNSVTKELFDYQNIRVIPGISYDVANYFDNDTVDVVFIDADHSYDGAKKDYWAWYPKVKTGGLFLFHDVFPRFGVYQLYNNELVKDTRIKEIENKTNQEYPSCIKVFKKQGGN